MSTCEQCYHGSATGLRGVGMVCLYILHEKRRRPCPGGDACTEFVTPEDYARRGSEEKPMGREQRLWTKREEKRLMQMIEDGKTYREIGEALGRTRASAQQHAHYMRKEENDDALQGAGEAGGE